MAVIISDDYMAITEDIPDSVEMIKQVTYYTVHVHQSEMIRSTDYASGTLG